MLRIGRSSDLFLALFVVAIVALLLIAVPSALLDFLIVVNIAISLLLLLVALYVPSVLSLFAFPTLLLLTTLFRLSLNVASTRLILLDGYAGEVIQSFGLFLVRGEVVVGILIFSIITIVNFVVIARGSSRVAEVAARFALDAMPGRQMSIDADMRAGLISAEVANQKREELKRESQLYGSMDGAMKFVQGDVIAGIIIIFINIIGGIYLGVTRGLSFAEASQTYTILTIGDGLVTQIPALLISICAGIIVTRVSSSEQSSLGADVGAQLFGRPTTLFLAGGLLLLIAMLPGLPWLAFVSVASIFLLAGILLRSRTPILQPASGYLGIGGSAEFSVRPAAQLALDSPSSEESSTLRIHLDAAVPYRLYALNSGSYESWWQSFRTDIFESSGLRLPKFLVHSDEHSEASTFSIEVDGTVVERGTLLLDSVLVEMNPDHGPMFGLEPSLACDHPLTGNRVFWAIRSPALRAVTEAAQIRSFDFFEFICLKVAAFFRAHPQELLALTQVYTILEDLGREHPSLIREVIDAKLIDAARLTSLLQALVVEGLSIRNTRQILEAVASFHAERGNLGEPVGDYVPGDLVSHIRLIRRRQLLAPILSERGTLKVFTLSDELVSRLEEHSVASNQDQQPFAPQESEQLNNGFDSLYAPLKQRGLGPVSVLCRDEVRGVVQKLLLARGITLRAISFRELDPQVIVERVGVWSL